MLITARLAMRFYCFHCKCMHFKSKKIVRKCKDDGCDACELGIINFPDKKNGICASEYMIAYKKNPRSKKISLHKVDIFILNNILQFRTASKVLLCTGR